MKKLISVLLCLFMLFGTVGCAETPKPQSQKSYEELKPLYDDIISEYSALLTDKYNGKELSAPDTENMDPREIAIAEAVYNIVAAGKTAEAAKDLGYGYKDLDGNGTPELILLSKYYAIRAIFTISEDKPVLLESAYGRWADFCFVERNRLLLRRVTTSDNIEEEMHYTCRVDGDKMAYDAVYGSVYDREKKEIVERFQIENGTRTPIDDKVYRALNREYQKVSQVPNLYSSPKQEIPFIYFPLVAKSQTGAILPIADFSSYAAIRNTYIEISRCIGSFNISEWEAGKYDNLFTFPGDRSFEYYTKLLYIACNSGKYLGYDEIDLNGDSEKELVLLGEDYNIKAIFTQKNGVPVLLDAFIFPYQTCWLDSEGFIHVDCEDHEELKYSLYEFAENGEYKQRYSFIVDNYGLYLMNDGKIRPITSEESAIQYDDYVRYPEPFSPNEYTRNVSSLTYTPIIETTDDLKVATEKTWHKYVNFKRSRVDFARSNTYVNFENVTDTQMDMKLKYVFIFSYPDPERENYLLDDIKEYTLDFSVRKENGTFIFDGNGMQGKLEFGQNFLWIIIDESSDERFPVGNYCLKIYKPETMIQ